MNRRVEAGTASRPARTSCHRRVVRRPAPGIATDRTEERPGGAANVARNVTALGAHCRLLSVVGDDEAGRSLASLLDRDRVESSLHRDPEFPTTVKLLVPTTSCAPQSQRNTVPPR